MHMMLPGPSRRGGRDITRACTAAGVHPPRIGQLVFTFPEDATTSTGAPFWSAPKRFPSVLQFDAADPTHASFVQVCVCVGGCHCGR